MSRFQQRIYSFRLVFTIILFIVFHIFPNCFSADLVEMYGNVTWVNLSALQFNYTLWPLQEGFINLQILNLNEYVELFHNCLINLQNYQGVDIIGLKSPVYLTRYDVNIIRCRRSGRILSQIVEVYYGKRVSSEEQCVSRKQHVKYEHKTTKASWSCFAQFDLFHPEVYQAPHIFNKKNNHFGKNMFMPYIYDHGTIETGKQLQVNEYIPYTFV